MKMSIWIGVLAAMVLAGCEITSTSKLGTGKDIIRFQSKSPYSFQEILDGLNNDKVVEISAELKFPAHVINTEKRVPAVVIWHGSGGVVAKHRAWATYYRNLGFATLLPDSYSARGVSSTVGNQTSVSSKMMVVDAFYALEFLSKHKNIDPNKIIITGMSKGGMVAYSTAFEALRSVVIDGKTKYAAHLPLYPACFIKYSEVKLTGAPIRIFSGADDDWVGYKTCVSDAQEFSKSGYDVETIVYKGVTHGFDRHDQSLKYNAYANSFSKCKIRVTKDLVELDEVTGLDWGIRENAKKMIKQCTTQGATYGGNAEALKKTKQYIKDFLSQLFQF